MANNSTDIAGLLDQHVSALTGSSKTPSSQNGVLTQQLSTITQQLQQLATINQTQVETMLANTNAVSQNTSTRGGSGESTASTIGSTLQGALGLGLGLSPLISGLVSLFGGGGGQSAPAAPVPFLLPLPLRLNAGFSASNGGGPFGVDAGQGGQPRPVSSTASTQITVQVQALDSQSFLDHSGDIARAVRQAMLETTVLNDVIREV